MARKRDKGDYCIKWDKLIAKGEYKGTPDGFCSQEPNKTAHVHDAPDMEKVREQ